ncbi:hypothetical protein MHYP_G00361410 [Metynnis hypsauchen]
MDASEKGLGAVLVQDFDGEDHPVLLISRKLTPAEQRYAALEREALAIKELRFYLTGRGGVPKALMEWSTWPLGVLVPAETVFNHMVHLRSSLFVRLTKAIL